MVDSRPGFNFTVDVAPRRSTHSPSAVDSLRLTASKRDKGSDVAQSHLHDPAGCSPKVLLDEDAEARNQISTVLTWNCFSLGSHISTQDAVHQRAADILRAVVLTLAHSVYAITNKLMTKEVSCGRKAIPHRISWPASDSLCPLNSLNGWRSLLTPVKEFATAAELAFSCSLAPRGNRPCTVLCSATNPANRYTRLTSKV